ncbi:MAG TPA: PAC2 family protein [Acidimicrobiales bacterium]
MDRSTGIVRWEERPSLRRPVLIAAFEGWNDAGDAATSAARYLARTWEARTFARFDPEEFYDFTSTRPQVRLVNGETRQIDWPDNEWQAAPVPGGSHDIVFLHGVEPQLRWRTFCQSVVDIVKESSVEMVFTLGALLADVPHSRPVRVSGSATNRDLVDRLHLQRSRYEGPTGIVGVLHESLARAGVPSASLWASVPHYVSQTPSPKAALALVERTAQLLGARVEPLELQIAASAYERQVTEVVEGDDDVAAYVRRLEQADDDEGADPNTVMTGDALADEVERFLRDPDI